MNKVLDTGKYKSTFSNSLQAQAILKTQTGKVYTLRGIYLFVNQMVISHGSSLFFPLYSYTLKPKCNILKSSPFNCDKKCWSHHNSAVHRAKLN